jgi:hypothetical protein
MGQTMGQKRPEGHPMTAENALWPELPEFARSELLELYEDLRAEVGFSGRLASRWARLVAEAWVATDGVSQEAAIISVRRRLRRGRAKTRQVVATATKRQALQIDTVDKALRTLRELAQGNGHHAGPTLKEIRKRYEAPA